MGVLRRDERGPVLMAIGIYLSFTNIDSKSSQKLHRQISASGTIAETVIHPIAVAGGKSLAVACEQRFWYGIGTESTKSRPLFATSHPNAATRPQIRVSSSNSGMYRKVWEDVKILQRLR